MLRGGVGGRRAHQSLTALLLTALLAAPALAALGPLPAGVAAQPAPPSILVIQTDDMRTDDLAAMPRTRGLLEAGGISFDNYIAGGTPLCCPNRATALTGKYPHNHGVLRNGGPDGGHQAFRRHGNEGRTIAVALDDAGYETAYVGKYMNGYPAGKRESRIPHGWDHWHTIIQDKACDDCGGGRDGFYYTYQMNQNGETVSYGAEPGDYSTSVIRREAMRIIERRSGQAPLFLWVNPIAPHGPSIPDPDDVAAAVPLDFKSPAYNARGQGKAGWIQDLPRLDGRVQSYVADRVRDRRRSLLAADRLVETLVQRMPAGSYVFFFSDNGYVLGEFRIAVGKTVPYKPSAEVPLLVVGPGVAPGRVTPLVASSIDLAPTWAAIAGVRLPGADGRSLLPVLSGRPPEWRDSVLLEWAGTSARTRAADLDGDVLPASLRRDNRRGDDRARPTAKQDRARPKAKQDRRDKREKREQRDRPGRQPRPKSQKRRAGIEQREFAVAGHYALRGADWLYIEWSDGTHEYYDHTRDPFELTNRYADLSAARQQYLAERVDRLKDCAGAACD